MHRPVTASADFAVMSDSHQRLTLVDIKIDMPESFDFVPTAAVYLADRAGLKNRDDRLASWWILRVSLPSIGCTCTAPG